MQRTHALNATIEGLGFRLRRWMRLRRSAGMDYGGRCSLPAQVIQAEASAGWQLTTTSPRVIPMPSASLTSPHTARAGRRASNIACSVDPSLQSTTTRCPWDARAETTFVLNSTLALRTIAWLLALPSEILLVWAIGGNSTWRSEHDDDHHAPPDARA